MTNRTTYGASGQKGFILITTLVFLVLLTVLGISQITMNSNQTQVATNSTDNAIIFHKTEGALNEAVNNTLAYAYANSSFNNTNGLYSLNPDLPATWQTIAWTGSAMIASFGGLSGTQAGYIIEQLPSVVQPGQNMRKLTRIFRITGQATGQSGSSSTLLQTTVQIQQ